jgi:peptidoglycan/xylan/chitin deacetylase (PgdA/CDA1 family)
MEFLAQNNLKATIFAVGSRVLYNPRLLQQQYMAGHQIAVHTW